MYAGIEEKCHKEPYSRQCKAEEEAKEKDLGPVRSDRTIAAAGLVYDLGIIVYHSL